MALVATLTIVALLLSFALVAYSKEACVQAIRVKTTNVLHGGTDAKVSIELHDKQGNMVSVTNLATKGINGYKDNIDYFEDNSFDSFAFRSECLSSKVCKIVVGHDGTGLGPEWNVNYVHVTSCSIGGECNGQIFQIHQEIASDGKPVTKDLCDTLKVEVKA